MSEPKRWRHDGDGVPPEAARYLRAGGHSRGLSAEARARSAARLAKIVAAPVLISRAWPWAKTIGLASTLLLVSIAAWKLTHPRYAFSPNETAEIPSHGVAPTLAPVVAASPPLVATQLPTITPPLAPIELPHPIAATVPSRSLHASTDSTSARSASNSDLSSGDALARESELLRPAHDALERDPRTALALLSAHAREFPHGQLAQEREWIAFDALRRLGRNREARARGTLFLRRFPDSYSADRVRHALDALP